MIYLARLSFCIVLLLLCADVFSNVVEGKPQSWRLEKKAAEALKYCTANRLNVRYCLLIDMGTHSGEKRAFLWDFSRNEAVASSLCSHGCGKNLWGEANSKGNAAFSNLPESYCTALGRYLIGKRAASSWGIRIKYLLHGLDPTNSNALKRNIVLHSWDKVSEDEIFPDGTPEGWGCPAVSNGFMKIIDARLERSDKPVLLWVFV